LKWIVAQNTPRSIHAIKFRHADVQDQKVGFQLRALLYRFAPVKRLSADLPSFVRPNQRTQAKAKNRMIIGQQYTKRIHKNLPRDGRK